MHKAHVAKPGLWGETISIVHRNMVERGFASTCQVIYPSRVLSASCPYRPTNGIQGIHERRDGRPHLLLRARGVHLVQVGALAAGKGRG